MDILIDSSSGLLKKLFLLIVFSLTPPKVGFSCFWGLIYIAVIILHHIYKQMSYQSFVYTIISSTTFPTISGNDSYMMDIPIDGCRLGDFVRVSFEANLDGLLLNAYVKSNDMVTVVAHNHKGANVTLPTANLHLQITKHQ